MVRAAGCNRVQLPFPQVHMEALTVCIQSLKPFGLCNYLHAARGASSMGGTHGYRCTILSHTQDNKAHSKVVRGWFVVFEGVLTYYGRCGGAAGFSKRQGLKPQFVVPMHTHTHASCSSYFLKRGRRPLNAALGGVQSLQPDSEALFLPGGLCCCLTNGVHVKSGSHDNGAVTCIRGAVGRWIWQSACKRGEGSLFIWLQALAWLL